MEKLNRGDKIYLDKENKKESAVNRYLECRDGIIKCYEYNDTSGYGSKTRLFLCENYKHECMSIIRQVWIDSWNEWKEEEMSFDSDSFAYLAAIVVGDDESSGAKFTQVRDS